MNTSKHPKTAFVENNAPITFVEPSKLAKKRLSHKQDRSCQNLNFSLRNLNTEEDSSMPTKNENCNDKNSSRRSTKTTMENIESDWDSTTSIDMTDEEGTEILTMTRTDADATPPTTITISNQAEEQRSIPQPGDSLKITPLGRENSKTKFADVYNLGDIINEGAFGIVYRGHHVLSLASPSHSPCQKLQEVGSMEQDVADDRKINVYEWWKRMGCPRKKGLVKIIQQGNSMKGTNLTVEDVELIPWAGGGILVDVPQMTKWMTQYEEKRQRKLSDVNKLGGASHRALASASSSSFQQPQEVAIKVVDRRNEYEDNHVIREASILNDLRDLPHITKIYDFYMDSENLYVVEELALGGDVFDKLSARVYYTEKDARDLCKMLLTTIQSLHERKIVHRDLKPENLLLKNTDSDSTILLCDFGYAKYLPTDGTAGLHTHCGTPQYTAPEIVNGEYYGTEVDMWSVGCIVYILLFGCHPFHADNEMQTYAYISECDWAFLDDEESVDEDDQSMKDDIPEVTQESKNLISNLLVLGKENRYTATQALECDWIANVPCETLESNGLNGSLSRIRYYGGCVGDDDDVNNETEIRMTELSERDESKIMFEEGSFSVSTDGTDNAFHEIKALEGMYHDSDGQSDESLQGIEGSLHADDKYLKIKDRSIQEGIYENGKQKNEKQKNGNKKDKQEKKKNEEKKDKEKRKDKKEQDEGRNNKTEKSASKKEKDGKKEKDSDSKKKKGGNEDDTKDRKRTRKPVRGLTRELTREATPETKILLASTRRGGKKESRSPEAREIKDATVAVQEKEAENTKNRPRARRAVRGLTRELTREETPQMIALLAARRGGKKVDKTSNEETSKEETTATLEGKVDSKKKKRESLKPTKDKPSNGDEKATDKKEKERAAIEKKGKK